MAKIAIVTDSTTCPTKEQQEKYQFEIVPLNILFEGKIYRDGVDLSPTEAYRFIEKNPDDFATSAPAPGDFLKAYKRAAEKGKKEILCIALGSGLSATWNSAKMAQELAKTEIPEAKIEVIDSRTGACAETILCIKAANLAEEGKNFKEIVQFVENSKERIKAYLLLETIRYIYRSGRIPEAASKIGALLSLKPILGLFDNKLHLSGAATSKQGSFNKLLKILKENFDLNSPEIGIQHADSLAEAIALQKMILEKIPQAKVFISEFSPVMGYACGRGTLLIGFFTKG
jgi:DegV family protein with EDD domain